MSLEYLSEQKFRKFRGNIVSLPVLKSDWSSSQIFTGILAKVSPNFLGLKK
jgi:hypothetical protein